MKEPRALEILRTLDATPAPGARARGWTRLSAEIRPRAPSRPASARPWAAAALAFSLVGALVVWTPKPEPSLELTTLEGRLRTPPVEGSWPSGAHLALESGRLDARIGRRARLSLVGPAQLDVLALEPSGLDALRLVQGTLQAEITPLPGTRFQVAVGPWTVQALGTRFEVGAEPDEGIWVEVSEGSVQVLGPGTDLTLRAPARRSFGTERSAAPEPRPAAQTQETAPALEAPRSASPKEHARKPRPPSLPARRESARRELARRELARTESKPTKSDRPRRTDAPRRRAGRSSEPHPKRARPPAANASPPTPPAAPESSRPGGLARPAPSAPPSPAPPPGGKDAFDAAEGTSSLERARPLYARTRGSDYEEIGLYRLGVRLLEAGERSEAERTFEELLKAHPRGRLRLEAQVGLLELAVTREDPVTAGRLATALEAQLGPGPLATEVRYWRAESKRRQGVCDLEGFRRVADESGPRAADARHSLAWCLAREGDEAAAVEQLCIYLEEHPRGRFAAQARAWVKESCKKR